MTSRPTSQKNEKTKGSNEGPIASRLRSSSKVEGKSSRSPKHEKEKGINKSSAKIQTEKVTKKSSSSSKPAQIIKTKDCSSSKPAQIIKTDDCSSSKPAQIIKTKDLSTCITAPSSKNQEQPIKKIKSSAVGPSSSNLDKGKEKVNPTQKPQDTKKPIIDIKPVHHIRWKGFENTSRRWNCSMCGKELLENTEKKEHEIQPGEDELQHILLSTQGREDQLSSVLPEVAVLPCTHVFHLTCLSTLHLTDPSCPICLSMLST